MTFLQAPACGLGSSMSKPSPHRLRRRPGWFRPVPLRSRRDGWSEVRQCAFLVQLYFTGSATAAAKAVGMSRASAYRLRERPGAESFAFAWDRVLSLPGWGHPVAAKEDFRKVTNATLLARLESDLVQPVVYRGAMVHIRRKPDDSALFRLLRRTGNRAEEPVDQGLAW
jgi:hypothetical protein